MDYQPLNAMMIKNRHPLSWINEMQDHIRGLKYFTKLNIIDAYYQICIAKGEEWKMTFWMKYGHYEYTVIPFRLINALASFQ